MCTIDTLQHVIGKGINESKDIANLLKNVRVIVSFFNQSELSRNNLKKIRIKLGLKPKKLHSDNETRCLKYIYIYIT